MTESSEKLLQKAARAIAAARSCLDAGYHDVGVGRSYYAMFYVAQALLNERGMRFRKHGGVHSAFGENFAKTALLDPKYHRWLLAAFNKRLAADYGTDDEVDRQDVQETIAQAGEFLDAGRAYLQNIPNPHG